MMRSVHPWFALVLAALILETHLPQTTPLESFLHVLDIVVVAVLLRYWITNVKGNP